MLSQNQHLKTLLAQGNLEAVLQMLVRLSEHTDDADLRQRVLTLSGQFAGLKKQHLTGLLEDKDYRLQLNRITAAVAEIADSETLESVGETQTTSNLWKKLGYVGLLIGILAGVVQILEPFQKPKPAPLRDPVVELPKKDTVVMPAPQGKPPVTGKKNVKIEVKDKAKVGNIITGDSNKIDIKQDF